MEIFALKNIWWCSGLTPWEKGHKQTPFHPVQQYCCHGHSPCHGNVEWWWVGCRCLVPDLCTETLKFNSHLVWPYAAHFQKFRLAQFLEQREQLLSNGDGYSWSVRLVSFWACAVLASQVTWTRMPEITPETLVFIREREEWWQVGQLSKGWPTPQRAAPYWAIALVEYECDGRYERHQMLPLRWLCTYMWGLTSSNLNNKREKRKKCGSDFMHKGANSTPASVTNIHAYSYMPNDRVHSQLSARQLPYWLELCWQRKDNMYYFWAALNCHLMKHEVDTLDIPQSGVRQLSWSALSQRRRRLISGSKHRYNVLSGFTASSYGTPSLC